MEHDELNVAPADQRRAGSSFNSDTLSVEQTFQRGVPGGVE
ncbi:hypothetical protein [Leptolyngbya sp. FACHB-16]|nr:hypothetical protein [Leptolyngbya sp. FACHB-16]